ncbi:MAG: protein arginine kinase [Clostridia bacterium]|jgi:protein arginine kinase|nr:protein arginine kinase [Clostridia bacterium]MCI9459922.1 protein arginine kinase [Clostridia bacterium]
MNNGTIVSTRIRLARNIDGLPFPHKLGEIPSRKIAESVGASLRGVDKFVRYDIADVPALDGTILQEKHLISPDLLKDSPFGSVFISADENVSVMVNEEDHIREQVILSGFSLDQAYDRVNRIDDILAKNLKFAYSPKYGYLTSCATNLGTGMRASVMMFLPALTVKNMMEACINDVARLNMTVRGVYGEGSKADGYLYQISNQRTLGVTEAEILDGVKSAINRVVDAELRARQLLKRDETELKDKILRAWGVALNAYKMDTAEAMQVLAMIRLGAYYGYIELADNDEFQRLITRCQPANMQKIGGENMSADDRDILRARYISANLKSIAKRADGNI